MRFRANLVDRNGAKSTKLISAVSEYEARQSLFGQGLSVLSIRPVKSDSSMRFFGGRRLSVDTVELITSQLAMMLRSGLTLDKSLEFTARAVKDDYASSILSEVIDGVRAGKALSSCLEIEWGFDSTYINLIKVGEETGSLVSVLDGLSDSLRFNQDLASKVKSAIAYPMFIFFVSVLSIFFLFNFVIPNLSVLFESGYNQLPWYTKFLLEFSESVVANREFIVVVMLLSIFSISVIAKTSRYRDKFIGIFMLLPLFGSLLILSERIRFQKTISFCIDSGLSLVDSLALSIQSIRDPVLRQELSPILKSVRVGSSLSDSLEGYRILDDVAIGVVSAGEQSSSLALAFRELARRDMVTFELRIKSLTAVLEPLLILLMSAIVGGVVVIMMMSIVSVQGIGL